MEIRKRSKTIFLVLVPHQDVRLELRKYSDSLHNTEKVYPFPLIAPLAVLSKPLNPDELKKISRSLRNNLGTNKIITGKPSITAIPINNKNMNLFGLKIDFTFPECITQRHGEHGGEYKDSFIQKIKTLFSPLLIGLFLVPEVNEQQLRASRTEGSMSPCEKLKYNSTVPPFDKLSFRAAAIANMTWEESGLDEKGKVIFEYKIGKLCWLPKTVQY